MVEVPPLLFGVVLSGVEFAFGLVVLLGVELLGVLEFISVLLDPEVDGLAEFISVLLDEEDGDVVDEGELDVLDPVGLLCVEGVLCELLAPLPAPLPSFPPAAVPLPLLWARAIPVEKIIAVASVKSLFRMKVSLPRR